MTLLRRLRSFHSQSRETDSSYMYLLVDFVQLLSFRSGIEVDVERTMNAPLKNRMGRKEFYAELQRNGNPLFVVLDAEEINGE